MSRRKVARPRKVDGTPVVEEVGLPRVPESVLHQDRAVDSPVVAISARVIRASAEKVFGDQPVPRGSSHHRHHGRGAGDGAGRTHLPGFRRDDNEGIQAVSR